MICIIALIIASIMGLFSAKYRLLAKEAFKCVFKRVTLRPCDTGLDRRIKSRIVVVLFKRNKYIASLVNRHFEKFSWFFVILLFVSLAFSINSLYNFFAYGNCNGAASQATCILGNVERGFIENLFTGSMDIKDIDVSDNPYMGSEDPQLVIYEFACLECPYSAMIQPEIDKIVDKYPVRVYFLHLPISKHPNSYRLAEAAECAHEQNRFWEYKDLLYSLQSSCGANEYDSGILLGFAEELELDMDKFRSCIESHKYAKAIDADRAQALKLGVKSTPTLFFGHKNTKLEGYHSYADIELHVKEALQ